MEGQTEKEAQARMEDQMKRVGQARIEAQARMEGSTRMEGQARIEVTREELLHQERIREVTINKKTAKCVPFCLPCVKARPTPEF